MLFDLNLLIFVAVIINFVIGIIILARDSKSSVNRFFAIFVLFLSLWIIANFLENEPGVVGLSRVELFLRLDFASAILFFYAWFQFCIEFTRDRMLSPRRNIWFGAISLLVAVTFSSLALFSNLIITDIAFDEVILFQGDVLILPYLLCILFYTGAGLTSLFRGSRRAKRLKDYVGKQQIDLLFWGFLISMTHSQVINFVQPFYPISLAISRSGLYGFLVMSTFTAYAITRHRLFDLRLVIARAAAFFVFIAATASLYVGIVILGIPLLFGAELDLANVAVTAMFTVFLAFGFQPVYRYIAQFTDKLFYKGIYSSEGLLSELTHIMADSIDLGSMTQELLGLICKEMKISKAGFILVEDHAIKEMRGIGYTDDDIFKGFEKLFHAPYVNTGYIVFEDIPEGDMRSLLTSVDVAVALPIKVEDSEVAILILGPKRTGERYYQRDVDVLRTFATEAGIAIQNAQSYLKIKRFSQELEVRVNERTKELKESQEKELAKAKEVARLKDEFVFIAAHELRTPVTAMRGFLELVSGAITNFPKDVKQNIAAVSSASEHLNQLINDLLQIARSEVGSEPVQTALSQVDIAEVIATVVNELDNFAKERGVSVSITGPATLSVLADKIKLREIVVNLLSNAIKYNRDNGSVTISLYTVENKAMLEISDTGYGISKEQQAKIFDKFFRAISKDTQLVLGTGLGLFISRMLAEKMGGSLLFSSVEGKGSTFALILPTA